MKASGSFTKTISKHLEQVAASDPLFAETFKKANKNITDCITYILNTVQKSGCNAFEKDEIFNMAIHYYDEDDIKLVKTTKCKVVTSGSATAGASQKTASKKIAKRPAAKEQYIPNQTSLFG